MTPIAALPTPETSARVHDQEARLLVQLLRSSRLALLFAEAGSDKTALLQSELMPLMCRRTSDRHGPAASRESSVEPTPDRRRRPSSRAMLRRRELVVYFDTWTETPLAALRAAIYRAADSNPAERGGPLVRLSQILEALSDRLDTHFVILLDRFEEFLRAPSHRVDIVQFANELVEAVTQPRLTANFLISIDEDARPRLASLRERIPGFDDFSLKLARGFGSIPAAPPALKEVPVVARQAADPPTAPNRDGPTTGPGPAATPVPTRGPSTERATANPAPKRPKVKRPRPVPVPVKTEDIYALIESKLIGIATGGAATFPIADPPVDPTPVVSAAEPAPADFQETASPDEDLPAVPSSPGPTAATPASARPNGPEVPLAPPRAKKLRKAVEWAARHLHVKGRPKQGT